MDVDAPAASLGVVGLRQALLDEPLEVIAHARLACLVAEVARDDAVLDAAAHARHRPLVAREDHVAGRRAHDHDHRAGPGDGRGRNGHVRVDVGDGDRGPHREAGPARRLGREAAGQLAGPRQVAAHPRVDDVREARVECLEVGRIGKAVALGPHRLVARGAGVAGLDAGESPDDPVGRLDQAVRRRVDLGRLVEDLERLREEPLRRDLAAVPVQPGLTHRSCDLVDPVRIGLGGVVLPELDPGMRVRTERGQLAECRAVGGGRQHRAGGEVDADPDDVGGIHARGPHDLRDGRLEDAQVVVGVLERPVGRQDDRLVRSGEVLVDDAVAIWLDGRRDLRPVGDVDEDGATRTGPEIDPDRVPAHRRSLRLVGGVPAARWSTFGGHDTCGPLRVPLSFPLTFTLTVP